MDRRKFIQHSGLLTAGIVIPRILKTVGKEDPTILVVSGWGDGNIGHPTQTLGILHVMETYVPNSEIILWKKSQRGPYTEEVEAMLYKNFPAVKFYYGDVDEEGNVDNEKLLGAFKESDIMIHGSGPSVVGREHLQAWHKITGKPFGIFGTTIENINDELKVLLEKASFIYTRETKSLDVLKEAGINRNSSFVPDATFLFNCHDEQKADKFLIDHDLEDKKFICAIPRLRYTPYHKISGANWSMEKIREVEETNKKHKEIDHAKLRQAIVAWVRETGNKVLICPEMTYQVDIMDELLIDPLPNDIKPFVIKRGYWMPNEAASIYARAHTLLSFECHSPIIAVANGTPAFYLRQPEDTIKGQMWYDLGFNDWVFEIEETEGSEITQQLIEVWGDYAAANQMLEKNMGKANEIYASSCKVIEELT